MPLARQVRRQGRDRSVEIGDGDDDPAQHAGFARALGVEQREFPEPRVSAHQGEPVGALDLVHPEVVAEEARERVSLGHPEGDVVEGIWSDGRHARQLTQD